MPKDRNVVCLDSQANNKRRASVERGLLRGGEQLITVARGTESWPARQHIRVGKKESTEMTVNLCSDAKKTRFIDYTKLQVSDYANKTLQLLILYLRDWIDRIPRLVLEVVCSMFREDTPTHSLLEISISIKKA